jgi:hypothetical protein
MTTPNPPQPGAVRTLREILGHDLTGECKKYITQALHDEIASLIRAERAAARREMKRQITRRLAQLAEGLGHDVVKYWTFARDAIDALPDAEEPAP